MSDIASGDDKKPLTEREKDALLKEKKIGDRLYTEKVTVEMWEARRAGGAGLLNPVKGVWAHREEKDGKVTMFVFGHAGNCHATKGSRITDAAGNVYEVTESEYDRPHRCELKLLKPAPKKKP